MRQFSQRRDHSHERARVAAELSEEARLLTEVTLPSKPAPAEASPANATASKGNGHAKGNGYANGNGHTNGNGHANGNGHTNGNGHANGNGKAATSPGSAAERALETLDQQLIAQPECVPLLLERATLLGSMGRYSAARADLEHALLLDPENLTVRSALGIVLLRKGLWSFAVPHLRVVVETESWSPTAWFYLGEALNHVDDLDGALAAFVRACELDPLHSKALYGQGVVLDRLHRPDDAAPLYRRSREVAAR